ncbi:hypothetical protein Rcae01_01130 [Novipirellula caenicola]|uniref:Uncharacterized protein n=1 Tax=Novipirellula caenicola TaxID=1536901 RepID=A0ABP9VKG5_9BACT
MVKKSSPPRAHYDVICSSREDRVRLREKNSLDLQLRRFSRLPA